MLVLSRRVGETILVGEVVVAITAIKGKRTTIGIKAPKSVRVLRGELLDSQGTDCATKGKSSRQIISSV